MAALLESGYFAHCSLLKSIKEPNAMQWANIAYTDCSKVQSSGIAGMAPQIIFRVCICDKYLVEEN